MVLCDIVGYCKILWDTVGYCKILWDIVGYCGILWDIVKYCGIWRANCSVEEGVGAATTPPDH